MKNLYKYLDTNGWGYEKTTFGADYFKNAPEIAFEGAYIELGYNEINSAAWKRLEKYCGGRGYSLKPWSGTYGRTVYTVCRMEDRTALAKYTEYMMQSVRACEKEIHLRHEGFYSSDSDREFDERLRGIMEYYGAEYIAAA